MPSTNSFRSRHVLVVASIGSLGRSSITSSESMSENISKPRARHYAGLQNGGDSHWKRAGRMRKIAEGTSLKTRLSVIRSLATPTASTPTICDSHSLHLRIPHCDDIIVENSIAALIDIQSAQALAEDPIMISREHAHTSNFCRHSRSDLQRDCNFTDCNPSFPVDSFDYHTTSTFTIVFGAASPLPFQRLQRVSMTIFLCPCAPMLAQWSASWLCSL